MRDHRYAHLSDAVLLHELAARVAQVRVSTATLVALIAEVDARRLYLPAGYPSMHAYCVEKLHLSDDEAYRRIHAARASRQFPLLLNALSEGRLHLTAVCTLAPHLTEENLDELVSAGTHKRKTDIEDFLATRFPQAKAASAEPDGASHQTDMIQQLWTPERGGAESPDGRLAPERVEAGSPEGRLAPEPAGAEFPDRRLAPERVRAEDGRSVPGRDREVNDGLAPGGARGARQAAPGSERMIQLTVRKATYDKLQYARALLSHAVRSGDASEVLDRALDLLIGQVEKRKVGAGTRKTVQRSPNVRSRYVPAKVRRAVWERDKGRCTFVGSNGHRCNSTRFLEFDHVDPFARGGKATIEGMRLRCRAHNQFEAGRAFGVEFMNRKRREARRAAAVARNTVESNGPRQSVGISRADRWRAVQEARGEGVEAGRWEGVEVERWEGIEAERWEGVEAEPIQFEPEHGSEKADERL